MDFNAKGVAGGASFFVFSLACCVEFYHGLHALGRAHVLSHSNRVRVHLLRRSDCDLQSTLRAAAKAFPASIVAVVGLMLLLCPVDLESLKEALYESLLVPPAIGLLLLFSLGRGGWLRTFLCSKPVQAVGLTSYGIYLWQQLFTAPKARFSFYGGSMQPSRRCGPNSSDAVTTSVLNRAAFIFLHREAGNAFWQGSLAAKNGPFR